MVNIHEYLDYRRFLADILAEKRAIGAAYSMRAIQKRLGLTSNGYLSNIIAGRSKLSLELSSKIGDLFGLSESEKKYFKTMVLFSHATTVDEKNHFFEQLLSYRRVKAKLLQSASLNLFSKWYYTPLRELLVMEQSNDYAVLGKRLMPPISADEVSQAVAALVKGGFIKKTEDDKWERCETSLTTGDDVHSFLVVRFQKDMLDLAALALTTPLEKRDISGVTLALSEECLPLLKEEIRRFRHRISQIAVDSGSADRIYRCSVQLFPLVKGNEDVSSN